jgi:hypothetical protein
MKSADGRETAARLPHMLLTRYLAAPKLPRQGKRALPAGRESNGTASTKDETAPAESGGKPPHSKIPGKSPFAKTAPE